MSLAALRKETKLAAIRAKAEVDAEAGRRIGEINDRTLLRKGDINMQTVPLLKASDLFDWSKAKIDRRNVHAQKTRMFSERLTGMLFNACEERARRNGGLGYMPVNWERKKVSSVSKLTAGDKRSIIGMFGVGHTPKGIGEFLGVDTKAVLGHLGDRGLWPGKKLCYKKVKLKKN